MNTKTQGEGLREAATCAIEALEYAALHLGGLLPSDLPPGITESTGAGKTALIAARDLRAALAAPAIAPAGVDHSCDNPASYCQACVAGVPAVDKWFGPDSSGGFYVRRPDGSWCYAKPHRMLTPAEFAALSPAAQQDGAVCANCDGTGDVHSADGEWRGACPWCKADQPAADDACNWRGAMRGDGKCPRCSGFHAAQEAAK